MKSSPKGIPHWVLPLSCGAFLVVFALWLLIAPRQTYSPEERRALEPAPTLTLQTLTDGSYTRDLSEWFSDHFPLRTAFVRLKAQLEKAALRGENNGVLFGKQDYLIPRQEYTEADYAVLRRNLTAAEQFAQHLAALDVPLQIAIVPRAVDVNRVHLPTGYHPANADAVHTVIDETLSLPAIDLLTPLREATDAGVQTWYKTDHHWTSEGAYLAYVALSEALGYTPIAHDRLKEQAVTDTFFGTVYSAAGLTAAQGDTIHLLRYEGDERYVTDIVQNGETVRTLNGFYDIDAATGNDPYNVFLGGTNACIVVEPADGGDTLPTLVIIKDSYAQSIAPYLAQHFRLILIDPRSYRATDRQSAVLDLIAEQRPCGVLLLCGLDTLCGDVDLRTLLLRADAP